MKKRMEQNLKKYCSLVLAVLLMFNTSSLQAFADVMQTGNVAEAVMEQAEGTSDTEVKENVNTEFQDSENAATEDTEMIANETTEDTEDIVTESTEDTEDIIIKDTEDTGNIVTETTEDTEDIVTETTEDTKDIVTETTEDTEDIVTEDNENPEDVIPDKVKTNLKINEITGNATVAEVLNDGSENPFVIAAEAKINLTVEMNRGTNTIDYASLSEEEKAEAEEAIANYLSSIKAKITIGVEENQVSFIDASADNSLKGIYKSQYLPVEDIPEAISAAQKEAEKAVEALVKGLAAGTLSEMTLAGKTSVGAGNYKLICTLENPDSVDGIVLGTELAEADVIVSKTAQSITIAPSSTSTQTDINNKMEYHVTSEGDISDRELDCIIKDENNADAGDKVTVVKNDVLKTVTVTPKMPGKYTIYIGLKETSAYEYAVGETQYLEARYPEWNFTVTPESTESLKAQSTSNYIVAVTEEDISDVALSWKIYEKSGDSYIESTDLVICKLENADEKTQKIALTPKNAKEFKVEFKLEGKNQHRETVKEEIYTPDKINRTIQVNRENNSDSTYNVAETFWVSEAGRNLQKDNLQVAAYMKNRDGTRTSLTDAEVNITVRECDLWDGIYNHEKLKVTITPLVLGEIEIDFVLNGDTVLYADTATTEVLKVKTHWPVTVTRSTTSDVTHFSAGTPITYTLDIEDELLELCKVEVKAYTVKTVYWWEEKNECAQDEYTYVVDRENKTITITPWTNGKLEFVFIFTDEDEETYYYRTEKTVNRITIERIASVSTVDRAGELPFPKIEPALSTITYEVSDENSVLSQEIVTKWAMLGDVVATDRQIKLELSEDKRTIYVTPYVAGEFTLYFTFGENRVYHTATVSQTLAVGKISQPTEIDITLTPALQEDEIITPEKKITYMIQDAADMPCDISM